MGGTIMKIVDIHEIYTVGLEYRVHVTICSLVLKELSGGNIMKKNINFRKLALTFIGFLVVAGLTIGNPITLPVEAAVSIPQVSIVSLDHYPFIEGDKNEFFIASKNYIGKVQYQLF